jgi:hypothetical protein
MVIAKTGNRFSPVFPIFERLAFGSGNFFPPGDKARALPTTDDLLLEES